MNEKAAWSRPIDATLYLKRKRRSVCGWECAARSATRRPPQLGPNARAGGGLGSLARYEREAKVLASLNHPNIGHIYGLEEARLVAIT